MNYQIYVDRHDGCGLAQDGCWGGEHAQFDNLDDAMSVADDLAETYPDCDWVVVRDDGEESYRVSPIRCEEYSTEEHVLVVRLGVYHVYPRVSRDPVYLGTDESEAAAWLRISEEQLGELLMGDPAKIYYEV